MSTPQIIQIPLTRGARAIIDIGDAELCGLTRIPPWSWQATSADNPIPVRARLGKTKLYLKRLVYFQREPTLAESRFFISNVNGNVLDCRRENLQCLRKDAVVNTVKYETLSKDARLALFTDGTIKLEVFINVGSTSVFVDCGVPFRTAEEAKEHWELNFKEKGQG